MAHLGDLKPPNDVPRILLGRGKGNPEKEIEMHIQSYCRRLLSYDSDKSNAFYGVLEYYAGRYQARFLCGLPLPSASSPLWAESRFQTSALIASLQWNYSLKRREEYEITIRRVEIFPSWSWVGWQLGRQHMSSRVGPEWRDYMINYGIKDGRLSAKSVSLTPFLDVEVRFQDGNTMTWRNNVERILTLERLGNFARWLRFQTWTTSFEGSVHQGSLVRLWLGSVEVHSWLNTGEIAHISQVANVLAGSKTTGNDHSTKRHKLLAAVANSDHAGLTVMIIAQKLGTDFCEYIASHRFYWPSNPRRERVKNCLPEKLRDGSVYDAQSPLPRVTASNEEGVQCFLYEDIEFQLKSIMLA
ncbi:hypothetical protein F5Y15DRAFT_44942 [Xylariaceae sp. FL0016]|nr:hypothetical protein F5Y15DRAFT_44942 [Xylariaceae sp. FL0016]